MKKILLLHGALGAKSQFEELEKILSSSFIVHTMNFPGHGGKPLPAEPFSIRMFAEDILRRLDDNKIEKINIFGYSMGGYAAMYLARNYPQRTGKIMTVATKFLWDEEIASREVRMLNYDKMKEKVPAYAAELEKRHAPQDLKTILDKTAEMMINLGMDNELKPEDYPLINNEIIVGLGDSDKMVTVQETLDVFNLLPNGRLMVLQNTPHPLERVKTEQLADEIKRFMM